VSELFLTLIQAILTVAVPIIAAYIARFLEARTVETRSETVNNYAVAVLEAVSTAVLHTAQTYVDGLKESGNFSKENQQHALNMAVIEAKGLLTKEAQKFIVQAYGDLNDFLATKIEAEIRATKSVLLL